MSETKAGQAQSESSTRPAALLIAVVLFLLTVSGGLALADESQNDGPESFALALPDTLQELESLTESSQAVSTEPSTDPAAAEELPHVDLGRGEAQELLTSVFPDALEEQAGVFADLEVEAFRSDHVAVVPPKDPAADPGLLSSLLPLRTENENGSKEVVDLNLEDTGEALKPINPLVDVKIPARLDQAVQLPADGVSITVESAADSTASVVSNGAAFYPNIAPESDLSILPTPTGFETLTQLRSPDAPTLQHFHLNLPTDGAAEKSDDGGAIINRGTDVIMTVPPPTAIDAGGEPVPVSLEVSGSTISIEAHPSEGAAYPILVDPLFDSYSWKNASTTTGIFSDWRKYAPNPSRFEATWAGELSGAFYSGLALRSFSGGITPGSSSNFNYYVPRYSTDQEAIGEHPESFIRSMNLSQVYFVNESPAGPSAPQPLVYIGLWNERSGTWASVGSHYTSEGQWANYSPPAFVNVDEVEDVKNGGIALLSYESSSYPRQLYVGSATVEVSDTNLPGLSNVKSPSQWFNFQTSDVPYEATDRGLGIHDLRIRYPAAQGGRGEGMITVGCVGSAGSPCPRTSSSAGKSLLFDAGALAQGEDWTQIYAVDPVGHWSAVSESRIKVDRVKPEVSLSGSLAEQASVGTKLAQYALNISGKDGDEATAVATTPVGTVGTGPGQVERPFGVAADSAGNIWVADTTNNRVVELDKNGTYIRQITTTPEGPFKELRGITVAPDGNIWVAEKGNRRVIKFSPTGQFISKITNAALEPFDVAVSAGGVVWVTDASAQKVWQLKEDGTVIRTIGNHGNEALNGSDLPFGIALDGFGNAWVAMQATNRILEISPSGAPLFAFGSTGSATGQFNAPFDVSVAPSGNIFVSDGLNNRIQEFKPDGGFMRQFGTLGPASNQLENPKNIAMAPGNRLLIADYGNKRIARWDHADRHVEAGVVTTEVKVDGALKDTYNPGCAAGKNCSASREWVMKADEYTVGAHKVEVFATDGAGNRQEKTLSVETHGDRTAPTVALSGSITEQATLGKTLPSYKVKVTATDPGPAEERKSGVASIKIIVDGKVVDSVSPGCPAEGCSLTREWTLTSSSYAAGWHWMEVVATDAAGKQKVGFREFELKRDTTAPELTLSGALPGAPEGWVQQGTRSATADATDQGGYGVKQIRFSIDGVQVGESLTQTCEAGSCPKSKTFWIDMSTYTGGAHSAVMTAEDLAGNVRKRAWTINVDPEGHISASEAEDTLEALDLTSPVNTVGESKGEVMYEGTAENLGLVSTEGNLVATGSAAPLIIPEATPGEFTVEVAPKQAYTDCPNSAAEESEAQRTGTEEEQLALNVTCAETLPGTVAPANVPITAEPFGASAGSTAKLSENGAAVVAGSVVPNVDLVTRPLYDGGMTFAAIRDATAPETFSWKVQMDTDQELRLVDSQTAEVHYTGTEHVAFTITATPARDAVGSSVPTSLSVSGDTLTLTVKHKAGSFVYPVVGGAGWEGGVRTYEVALANTANGSGTAEGGEVYEGSGDDSMYREMTIGPPQPGHLSSAPLAVRQEGGPVKERTYNFHDCRFNPNGYNGENPPGTPGNVHREGIKKCHGEESQPTGGYYTISWAVSIHGRYEYKPHGWVWVPVKPECEKWGPEKPAKLRCFPDASAVGQVYSPKLDVLGFYRFGPGKFGSGSPFSASCYRIDGVLPNYWVRQEGEEPGHHLLEDTFHTAYEYKNPGDQCDWQHLSKIQ